MKKTTLSLLGLLSIAFLTSCDDDSNNAATSKNLTLNFTGLEDLGANYKYEGWVMVNGKPVTTGVFSVNSNGVPSQTSFPISTANLDAATKFILTIEPFPDSDPNPTNTHILAGDFVSNSATLTIAAPEALGNNFTTAKGKYVLATPSDGDNNNEKSGVWFIGSLPPSAGLDLPTLPEGWKYEGWAVINGKPISTGTFTKVSGADAFSGFSGTLGTPPFPGEDFIKNAPSGVTFPTDLSGKTAVISIEPFPDNSTAPFSLKPLIATISATAMDHVVYSMNNNAAATSPTGMAKK
jgi:acyl-CoA-binding protein